MISLSTKEQHLVEFFYPSTISSGLADPSLKKGYLLDFLSWVRNELIFAEHFKKIAASLNDLLLLRTTHFTLQHRE